MRPALGQVFATGGATKAYTVGESFVELPEVVGQARNAGAVPTTGGSGMARVTPSLALILFGGWVLVASCWLPRRQAR